MTVPAINEITNLDDFTKILSNDQSISIIDCYTQWCQPCKQIAPLFLELSKKYPSVSFNKMDIETDSTKNITDSLEISSLPTFCFFSGGKYVNRIVGADMVGVEKMLESLINQPQPQPQSQSQPQLNPPTKP